MSLRDTITQDLKSAMRAKDQVRLATLRLIQAAIKDRDIAARAEDRCDGCEDSGDPGAAAKAGEAARGKRQDL
jgi:hypothetical protein